LLRSPTIPRSENSKIVPKLTEAVKAKKGG
jgi:hypothetical protein